MVHTPVAVDHHGVDALLDVGSDESLLVGVQQLRDADPTAVAWACTSGSFVFGWELARHFVTFLADGGVEVVGAGAAGVLTANQVTVWHALHRAGITVTGERIGRLLS